MVPLLLTRDPIMHRVASLLPIVAILLIASVADARTVTGRVTGVQDGDSITVTMTTGGRTGSVRVRLAEIDAPESRQPFGNAAKRALSDRVFRKVVTVRITEYDRFGRAVAHVHVGNTWVNGSMVKSGYAWFYERYGRDPQLRVLQEDARARRVGLWADASPIPPWEWRRAGRGGSAMQPATAASRPQPAAAGYVAPGGAACGKRTCGQMSSCAEARHHLVQCGVRLLDRDGDGRPCESLCR